MVLKGFFTFWIIVLYAVSALAVNPVLVYDSTYEIHISPDQLEILEDKQNKIPFSQISENSDFNFTPLSKFEFTGFKNTSYWVKFQVINYSSKEYKWILQAPLHSEYIELYFHFSDDSTQSFITGQSQEFITRDYEVRSLAFSLPSLRSQPFTVYSKVHNRTYTDLHFIITDQKPYTRVLVKGYIFLGIIYGILFLMALYNLILFISIKSSMYIYYVLYILISGIFISWKDGLAFQYIWPKAPWINGYHHKVSIFLLVITVSLYAISFLELKERFSNFYKIILLLLSINSVLFVYRLTRQNYFDAFPADYLCTFVVIAISSVYALFKGLKSARYFILGFFFMLSALIILKLRYHGILEWSQFTEDSLDYSVVVEAIAMSLALRDKLVELQLQKEAAQLKMIEEMKERENAQKALIRQMEVNEKLKDKVNKELEEKVEERTKVIHEKVTELNIANQKLDEAYKKLSEFSVRLDIDNWDLKKSLKEEALLRIQAKEVHFSKFIEIFPTELECHRLLYELKWGDQGENFLCNRCGNKKSFDIQKRYSRKCTKCNYIETATANTLFHGIKFEIQKAFYIAYLCCSQDNISATKISEEINLRINTCTSFRKKVMTRIEEYKSKNKTDSIKDWTMIAVDFK